MPKTVSVTFSDSWRFSVAILQHAEKERTSRRVWSDATTPRTATPVYFRRAEHRRPRQSLYVESYISATPRR